MFKNIQEYLDLICGIESCLNWYENKEVDYTRYTLHTTCAKSYEIIFNKGSIAHLLGINTTFLRSTGLYTGNSYDILKSIIEEPNLLYSQIRQGHIKQDDVFSKHISKKLNSFRQNCSMQIKNIEFIVPFDKEKSYSVMNGDLDGDLYIAFEDYSNSNVLNIIGFKKNDNNKYFPMTNLEFSDCYEERDNFLKKLLTNQTITSVYNLTRKFLTDEQRIEKNTYFYKLNDKEKKLRNLKRYSDYYDCSIDTYTETMAYVRKAIDADKSREQNDLILDKISTGIRNKKFINVKNLENSIGEINDSILQLIGAHNDSLNNEADNSNDVSINYQSLIEELRILKNELRIKNDLINSLNSTNAELLNNFNTVTMDNERLRGQHEAIRKILK